MCEILSELPVHSPDLLLARSASGYAVREVHHSRQIVSLQDLLAELEQEPPDGNRSHVIARYQAWIRHAGASSKELFAAWFNVGVELVKAGDKAGAIDAYRQALELRPGFDPAAYNLSLLLHSTAPQDEARAVNETAPMDVLHVGCGVANPEALPPVFRQRGWREVRLDIDPAVKPDYITSITDMSAIADGAADAVYSSHNVEHLYPHEVAVALGEMRRVLKPSGFVLIMVPDLQAVARFVADGQLEDAIYVSPMGPIAALDMLYGHRQSMANGNIFMAHRTGFTCGTLGSALLTAGFAAALVQRDSAALALAAIGFRTMPEQAELEQAQTQMLRPSVHAAIFYVATK